MPTRPSVKAQTKLYSSVGIIQSIMTDPNNDLLDATIGENILPTTESIRAAGQYITAFVPRANQFINALVNRIGMVRITSAIWNNPWSWAKRGKLEMGETVEETWIGLAKAFGYNPAKSETRFLKQQKPDVMSAFHTVNYRIFYKVTVNMQDLKNAFLSVDGLTNFIDELIAQCTRTAPIDEFMMMKYTIAITLLNGGMKAVTIPAITASNGDEIVTTVTTLTNDLQFPMASKQYNKAGVVNPVSIDDIYILESTKANALLKVNVLANAFNIDEVKFMGHVTMHDGLGNYDWDRMADLLSEDPGYVQFTQAQINMLNSVEVLVMSKNFMQIYDNYEYMSEPLRNGEGLFENYFYHVGKVLGTSPFHPAIAYTTTAAGTITVAVTPATASVSKGQSVVLSANVTSTGFGDLDVIWSISSTKSRIVDGILYVSADETAETITVTATSVSDASKKGTATITIEP